MDALLQPNQLPASFMSNSVSLPLHKFSFVTSSIEQTKHVWVHVSPTKYNSLVAVFHSSPENFTAGPQRRLVVQQGTDILVCCPTQLWGYH